MTGRTRRTVSELLDQAIARGEADLANTPGDLSGLQEVARILRTSDIALSEQAENWVDYPGIIARLKGQNAEIGAAARLSNAKVARLKRRLRLLILWRRWGIAIIVAVVVLTLGVLVYAYRELIQEWLRTLADVVKPATPEKTPTMSTPPAPAPAVTGGEP